MDIIEHNLARYGALLLLSAWLPVVFGLAHLYLEKTECPPSLVQALVGTIFFPIVQPILYIRLLLLHQVVCWLLFNKKASKIFVWELEYLTRVSTAKQMLKQINPVP